MNPTHSAWPEKAELTGTIQKMLKTVPVGMFALARDSAEEICLLNTSGVRYTIQPPQFSHGRDHYAVLEWGSGSLTNLRRTHLLASRWDLLTWITQYLLRPEMSKGN